jgi:trehalose-6-phosphatase
MQVEWEAVKRCVCAVMADYEGRVNGSVLREYESLVAWDFRAVDAEWAVAQARFLAQDCEQAIAKGGMEGAFSGASASANVQVSLRNARVEVSLRCINKGTLAKAILDRVAGAGAAAASPPIDFILAIGDDATDEASFEAVGQWKAGVPHACTTFTATVGK